MQRRKPTQLERLKAQLIRAARELEALGRIAVTCHEQVAIAINMTDNLINMERALDVKEHGEKKRKAKT